MGRWADISGERFPRDWMLPDPGDSPVDPDLLLYGVGTQPPATDHRKRRPTWARSARGPLRRNEGVPTPVETPLYLHRQELTRIRARRRSGFLPVALVLAAAAVTGVVLQLLVLGR